MRLIGRFFLLIALFFLTLDLQYPITSGSGAADTAPTGSTDPAAGGTTGGQDASGTGTAPAAPATETLVAEDRPVILHALGERIFDFDPSTYQLISPAVSRHVSPWLDDNVVQPLLLQPAFLIFFALWLVFSILSWMLARARSDDDW